MSVDKAPSFGDEFADLTQVVSDLIEKCKAEEAEYRLTKKLSKRYGRGLVWLVIWIILACVVVVCGNGSPMLWAALAYLVVLLIVFVYVFASLRAIGGTEIVEPPVRNQATGDVVECRPEQVEELFGYYWAIDKRNDRVSTTMTIAGTVIGVSTLALVIALVVMLVLGL